MENNSTNLNALSNDKIDLNIKTLNPEKDLLYFLKEMNFKLSDNKVKYPKVRLIILIPNSILLYSIYLKFLTA